MKRSQFLIGIGGIFVLISISMDLGLIPIFFLKPSSLSIISFVFGIIGAILLVVGNFFIVFEYPNEGHLMSFDPDEVSQTIFFGTLSTTIKNIVIHPVIYFELIFALLGYFGILGIGSSSNHSFGVRYFNKIFPKAFLSFLYLINMVLYSVISLISIFLLTRWLYGYFLRINGISKIERKHQVRLFERRMGLLLELYAVQYLVAIFSDILSFLILNSQDLSILEFRNSLFISSIFVFCFFFVSVLHDKLFIDLCFLFSLSPQHFSFWNGLSSIGTNFKINLIFAVIRSGIITIIWFISSVMFPGILIELLFLSSFLTSILNVIVISKWNRFRL